ncbi:MAG: glycosyltransferase [Thermoleophilia bacterium]
MRSGHGYEGVLRAARRAGAHFIAVSDATAEYLHDIRVPPDRVAVIPNAIPRTASAAPDENTIPARTGPTRRWWWAPWAGWSR